MRRILYSLSFLLAFICISVSSIKAETLTVTFDDAVNLPEGWEIVGDLTINNDRGRSGASLWTTAKSLVDNYLVTENLEGSLSFYWRSFGTSGSYPNGQIAIYRYENDALGERIWLSSTYKSSTWKKEEVSLGNYEGKVAIALYSACIDDLTYTKQEVAAAPVLSITGQPSGSTFNFGGTPVAAGTTKTFTLANKGSNELTISSITITGDYAITEGADISTIAPLSTAVLTIATPEKDTEGVLTIVSNDANSPYTILLSSQLKVPAPEMVIATTEITFGRVTENAMQTVVVSNTGDADLTAAVASNSSEFTVSPTTLTVKPGETGSFDVTFVYQAESYGLHTGIVTVSPNVGQPVEIAVSAKVDDPNAWMEDFSSNALPLGWEVDTQCWSFSDGVAHASYGSYNDGYRYFLTTPTLQVEAGDELEFQAKSTGIYSTIKISVSKDGGEFVSYKNINLENNMTEFATYVISGLQSGSYVFRFANDDYDLDNFSGLQLSKKDHSAQVTALDIANKGIQYLAYTATVSVKELAGKNEELTVRFFIGDQQYGESLVETVDAYTTKTFTVSFTPDEAVSGEAYFTIANDNISLTSQSISVSISKAPTLDEDNGSFEDFENWSDYDVVALRYTMKVGWNTIILPFDVSDLSIFGSEVKVYRLEECTGNILKFKSSASIVAQQPYLLFTDKATELFKFYDVKNLRTNSDSYYLNDQAGNALFQGTYAPAEAGSLNGKYVLSENGSDMPVFVEATNDTELKGFRAYMELPRTDMEIFLDDVSTGITTKQAAKNAGAVYYNLNGQRVVSPNGKGLYITKDRKFYNVKDR